MTGSGNLIASSKNRLGRIAERVAGKCILGTDDRSDVARQHFFDFLARVRVHAHQAPDALALVAARGVEHRLTGREFAGIDAHVRQATDVWIGDDLECQRGGWLVLVCPARLFFRQIVRIQSADRRDIHAETVTDR